jgi:hypothetical protein
LTLEAKIRAEKFVLRQWNVLKELPEINERELASCWLKQDLVSAILGLAWLAFNPQKNY